MSHHVEHVLWITCYSTRSRTAVCYQPPLPTDMRRGHYPADKPRALIKIGNVTLPQEMRRHIYTFIIALNCSQTIAAARQSHPEMEFYITIEDLEEARRYEHKVWTFQLMEARCNFVDAVKSSRLGAMNNRLVATKSNVFNQLYDSAKRLEHLLNTPLFYRYSAVYSTIAPDIIFPSCNYVNTHVEHKPSLLSNFELDEVRSLIFVPDYICSDTNPESATTDLVGFLRPYTYRKSYWTQFYVQHHSFFRIKVKICKASIEPLFRKHGWYCSGIRSQMELDWNHSWSTALFSHFRNAAINFREVEFYRCYPNFPTDVPVKYISMSYRPQITLPSFINQFVFTITD